MASGRGTVTNRVIEAVAAETERDALDLPPLYDVVDPEALNDLATPSSNFEISFAYAGHEVTVEDDGAVSVDEQITSGSKNEPVASSD